MQRISVAPAPALGMPGQAAAGAQFPSRSCHMPLHLDPGLRRDDMMNRLRHALLAAVMVTAIGVAAPAFAADMNKTLHVAFVAPENGFDPQATSDLYSNYVNREIFDPLYRYDYLARPYKVIPNTATTLPEVSADGLTWTIKVRPGIYFTDDPAFKGKKRELTAADYVYSWKRVIDPRMRSPNLQQFDGKFEGADVLVRKARETGKFD